MKKIFKLIGTIVFVAVFTLSSATCFGQSGTSKLVGKWVEETKQEQDEYSSFEFFKDGSGTLTYLSKRTSDSMSHKFTWIATENGNLTITVSSPFGYDSDDSRFKMNCEYKISASILTLTFDGEEIRLKRK